jgi:hypothetical protein
MDIKISKKDTEASIATLLAASAGHHWSTLLFDYKNISYMIKNFNDDWDINSKVKVYSKAGTYINDEKDMTILEHWSYTLKSYWNSLNENEFNDFIGLVKVDMDWISKKVGDRKMFEGFLTDILLGSLKKTFLNVNGDDIYSKWIEVFTDIVDPKNDQLKEIIVLIAMKYESTPAIESAIKLLADKNKSIDINNFELNNIDASDIVKRLNVFAKTEEDIARDSATSVKYKPRKLGSMAKSVATIKLLEKHGFDMNLVDGSGLSSVDALLRMDVSEFSKLDRNEIVSYLNEKYISKRKAEDQQGALWNLIEGSVSKSDIYKYMGAENWTPLRGKDNETALHVLAKKNSSVFLKYALTVKGAAILNEKDNFGYSAIQYLLSYHNMENAAKVLAKIEKINKVSWKETMMLAISSKRDSAMLHNPFGYPARLVQGSLIQGLFIETPEEIVDFLKTEQSKNMVAEASKILNTHTCNNGNSHKIGNILIGWMGKPYGTYTYKNKMDEIVNTREMAEYVLETSIHDMTPYFYESGSIKEEKRREFNRITEIFLRNGGVPAEFIGSLKGKLETKFFEGIITDLNSAGWDAVEKEYESKVLMDMNCLQSSIKKISKKSI